ncbi:MAG: beta strand repeat-containing protein, partial [Gemmatimonadaceae bacterium]
MNQIVLQLGLSTLTVGQTVQASAIAQGASGGALSGVTIAWTSSNAAVASVTAAGLVTAVAPGTATITGSASGKSASASVTVVQVPVAAVSVALTSSDVTVGAAVTATATTRDASNNVLTGRTVTWSSNNTGVATVSSTGVVTTVGAGPTNIIATSEGITGSATLSVRLAIVNSVTVTLGSSTLGPGGTTTATAVILDISNNVVTGRAVTWSSSDISIATVTANGTVTAVAGGSATITATVDGVSGGAGLTVQVGVGSVSVTLLNSTIVVGAATTAVATVRDAAGVVLSGRTIAWTSSNPGVATVSSSGAVQGVAQGITNIAATADGVSGSASLAVNVPVASVTVTLGSTQLNVGATTIATALVRDAAGNIINGRTVSWLSTDPTVATVAPNGTVTGVKPGPTTIVGSVDGVNGPAGLNVVNSGGGQTGSPATQLAMSGQPGNAFSGVAMATPPVVEIRDVNNARVAGANNVVTAAIATGTGTLTNATVAAVNGVATFSNLHVNGVGPFTLTFTAAGLTSATSNSFSVTQLPAALSIQVQPSGAVTGSPLTAQPVIRVLDNGGQVIANSTIPITATAAGGALSGTTTVNAVGGVATFTDLVITGTGASSLTFSTPGVASVTSAGFAVAALPATQLAIATQPNGAASDVRFTVQPVVEIHDANNGIVSGSTVAVSVAVATGTGVLSGVTTVNAVNGVATFTDLTITGTGAHTLVFTSGALTQATSGSFTVTASPPTQLAITTQPTGAISGVALTTQPAVEVRDAGNGVVLGSTIPVTAAVASGGGVLSGTTTVSAVNGVATFTNLAVSGSGNVSLRFSSPNITSATSAVFTIGASPPTQLVIFKQPAGATSGINLTTQPVVQVRDANNNIVTGPAFSVTAAITAGTGTLVGTKTVNSVNGVATFTSLRINGSGQHTLTFTANGLTQAASNSFAVAQVAASLSIQTQPGGAVTGSPLQTQPVIRILDNAGLVMTSSTLAVTATRTTGTATLVGTNPVTAVAGVATFTDLQLNGVGNTVLTFTTTSPNLQVASAAFNVAPGPPSQLILSAQPTSSLTSTLFVPQPVVRIADAGGNTVTTSTAAVTVSVNSGLGAVAGTLTINAVAGVATYTDLQLIGIGAQTLKFSSAGLTDAISGTINVVAPGNVSGSIADLNAAAVGGGVVELLSGGSVVKSATVAGNGTYTISTILPQSYSVRLQPAFAYSMGPAEPANRPVTVTSGNTTVQNFVVQRAVWSEDFQSYTSSSQLTAGCTAKGQIPPAGTFFSGTGHLLYCSGSPDSIQLDPSGGPSGTKAVKYAFPARPTSGCDGNNGANYALHLTTTFSPAVQFDTLWVRFTTKESSNFTNGLPNCAGTAYKWLLID